MLRNPFKYGKEVSGDQFYDREEAFRQLYRKLSDGSSNVVMYAPRRYGKTSLVKKVLQRLGEDGVKTIYFDMSKVESLERFCEEYATAVAALGGKIAEVADVISRYLSHLHPTIGFGGNELVSVRFDYGTKMTPNSVSAVLDMAERLATDFKLSSIVVAFDEFQEIANLSTSLPLEGVFRGCIQAHQHVNYIFFGSKTHLLKRMFGDHSRPFYQSAAVMKLDKPPRDESVAFVTRRFAARQIGVDDELAVEIVDAAENIPYYIQRLGYFAFEAVTSDGRDWLEKGDILLAIDNLLEMDADFFSERLVVLSPSQRTLLMALAREPTAEFTEDYRCRNGLSVSATVHAALKVLVNAGIVEREDTVYRVGDPFFARFLRARPWR